MSIETWTEKFLPPITDEVTATELSAVRHCQQKWAGALVKNLKRHKVAAMRGKILDLTTTGLGIEFSAETCALCEKHTAPGGALFCEHCVLCQIRGGVNCCLMKSSEALSPFHMFTVYCDPKPMLRLLKRAERHLVQIEKGTNAGH